MNILMLNRFDIYSLPGTVRMVELSQQFVKKGHQVTLCYYPNEERRKLLPLLRDSDPIGVKTIKLSTNKKAFFKNSGTIRELARSVDIIHFQKCFPETALVALWTSYLEKKPLHYDWDDLEMAIVPEWTKSKVIYHIVKKYEEWLPSMVDSVSYSTRYVSEMAIERGSDPNYLIPAPVGADISRFNPLNSGERIKKQFANPLVVYIGQLEGGSYVDLFLQAAQQVIKKNPNIKFLVVGGGHRLPALQDMARNLGLESCVTFTNYVPHDTIPEYVAAADVCVACFEDNEITRCKSPLKIAEYLAAGKPIVASGVGDVPRMVDGAGIVVPPGNPSKLAEGILTILQNPSNLEDMKKAARRQAETIYNWSVIADRFLDCYQKTISSYQGQ